MIGQVQLVATGDSTTFAAISWFYQALGLASTDTLIYSEANNPRYSLRAFPSTFDFPNVVAANVALSGWTIPDLETQAPTLDALVRADYVASAGRPKRLNILALRIGTNLTSSDVAVASGRIRTYCLARQAAGWKVILCPIWDQLYTSMPTRGPNYVQPMNAAFAGFGTSDGVAAVVPATNALLYGTGASANTTYFNGDQVHLTSAGYALAAAEFATVYNRLVADNLLGPPSGAPTLSSSGVSNYYDVALAWTLNGNVAGRGAIVQWRDHSIGGAWLYSSTVSGASGVVTMNYAGAMTWDVRVQTFNDDGSNNDYSNTIQVSVG